jgi:hypothetical protein
VVKSEQMAQMAQIRAIAQRSRDLNPFFSINPIHMYTLTKNATLYFLVILLSFSADVILLNHH